jgi:hypothetical protein
VNKGANCQASVQSQAPKRQRESSLAKLSSAAFYTQIKAAVYMCMGTHTHTHTHTHTQNTTHTHTYTHTHTHTYIHRYIHRYINVVFKIAIASFYLVKEHLNTAFGKQELSGTSQKGLAHHHQSSTEWSSSVWHISAYQSASHRSLRHVLKWTKRNI